MIAIPKLALKTSTEINGNAYNQSQEEKYRALLRKRSTPIHSNSQGEKRSLKYKSSCSSLLEDNKL